MKFRNIYFFKNLCIFSIILIIGCQSATTIKKENTIPTIEIIKKSHSAKPDWITSPPFPDAKNYYFVGISENLSTEKKALDDAFLHALYNAAAYAGITVKQIFKSKSEGSYYDSSIKDPWQTETWKTDSRVEALLSRVVQIDLYSETLRFRQTNGSYKIGFNVWVLTKVPKQEIENLIEQNKKKYKGILKPSTSCILSVDSNDLAQCVYEMLKSKFHVSVYERKKLYSVKDRTLINIAKSSSIPTILYIKDIDVISQEIPSLTGKQREDVKMYTTKGNLEIKIYDVMQDKIAGTYLLNGEGIGYLPKDSVYDFYKKTLDNFNPLDDE